MHNTKAILVSLIVLAIAFFCWASDRTSLAELQTQSTTTTREDAYRVNNIGVALLEQFKYKEAADSFKRALQIDPKLNVAHTNLSIALFNLPDLAGSALEAQKASTLTPDAPQPFYIIGLIAKAQSRSDDAITAFQRVLKIDPNDVGTNINLGQIYSQQRKYPEAIAAFRIALAAEPYNATALYNLGQALMRSGQREEGQAATARFQDLRQRGSATTIGQNYLEQGRYAEAIASTGAEADLVDTAIPAVTFTDASSSLPAATSTSAAVSPALGRRFSTEINDEARREIAGGLVNAATLFDYDNDGDLDLLRVNSEGLRLLRNDAGTFTDVTDQAGALSARSPGPPVGAVAGDFDNDGKSDLFVIRYGALTLYHNDGGGKFSDVTSSNGIPAYAYLPSSAAFVDLDHDGDLDLFITGLADLSKAKTGGVFPTDFPAAANLLLRNDGNGKFTDITGTAKLNTSGHAIAVVPTDFNNRRDMDLLIVNYDRSPELFSNQRDGTFRNVTKDVGLEVEGHYTCVTAGDINKDGYVDFFLGRVDAPGLFALSDGKEKFKTTPAPAGTENARSAQIFDYDNDGLLDCVIVTDKGVRVLRNIGNGWTDTSEKAVAKEFSSARSLTVGDIDNDGDMDLVSLSSAGSLSLGRNEGGNRNHSLRVDLIAKVSNRSSLGSKVELRAGSLVQKLETSSATPAVAPANILFGLGKRNTADAVRIIWPAGIVQAETEFPKASADSKKTFITLVVTELDRKPSSCPYLYSWNGERFEFITDFMGGGEMGYLEEPGRHNKPDPTEYVRIRSDQLKERNGRFELRVTNELEEALFADQFQLIAVDHPEGAEVYPNEGMTDPPRPFKIFETRGARPPLSAIDNHGNDVLLRITKMDRQYPDDFRRDRIRGYAEEHSLTMKLAPDSTASREQMLLLLTGWTDYAWSSDNVAASQAGKNMMLPALQVKDKNGKWRTVIEDIGIPVGRPQTVTVDLTGKFLSVSREVRIVTNMRILWDQILVDTSQERSKLRLTRLDPSSATLRWRGFSRETTPDGREPFGYDYEQVGFLSPWKVMPGHYTREGDVRELLLSSDDMFVVSRPGDEIALSFDSGKLPPLATGWTRTYLLYSDGYSKEMDINSASPDQVLPLPFHGMSKYPYTLPEAYPMTAARRAYLDRYNTRVVRGEISTIDALLLLSNTDKSTSQTR